MMFLLIVLLVISVPLLSQEEQELPVARECVEAIENVKKATSEFAALDSKRMIEFYNSNAPDLIVEWQKRCTLSAEKGTEYTRLMIKNFLDIDKFRENNPEEYERLVKQQQNESLIRTTSLEIQILAKKNDDNDRERLNELKLKLKKLMEDAFDEAQRRQILEINRLENEVRNLRNLAEQRAANKQSILQQRFILLTDGQEWPK